MNKKKRNIFQSIKKDILKGFKRLYFFSYTFLKYNFFSITAFILKKKIQTFKISLLLPTRERSKKFERLLLSLIKTCQYQNRVEILLLLDEDDKEIDRYKEIIKKEIFRSLNFIFIIKNLKSHAIRNNHLAELSTGNIIFPINDDMIFVSKRWDYFIDREFSKIDMDRPFCIWIKSNIKYSYLHCDYPIINKSWHKRLGYVGSENFNFWYLDTWICDLSMRSGRYLITPNIKVDQLSANKFKNEIDETHLRNINSDKEEKDYNIWQKTRGERIKHAKLLN
mgnify:FL=1